MTGGVSERPHVLAFAFECEPDAGSEPGAAWGVVKALAGVANVTVLVGSQHLAAIERWLEHEPDERLTFVGVHTPRARLFNHLTRFHRQFWFVRYLAWLRRARRRAQELVQEGSFDAAVHVAYGSYWLPSPVVDLGIPRVWGPVGGATTTPPRLMRFLGWKGILGEYEGRAAIRLFSWLPSTRRTWRKATIVLSETEATRQAFPREIRERARVINRAILSRIPSVPTLDRDRYLIFPSSLQGRKGPRLAVEALAHTPSSVRLLFISDGYERGSLQELAEELGVADRVEFHGRIPRSEMFKHMAASAGAVYAGLREEGGCALAESMLAGCPVIVLGIGGARLIAETNTDPERVAIVEPTTADQTAEAMGAAMGRFSAHPSQHRGNYLDQESVEAAIQRAVLDAIAQTG